MLKNIKSTYFVKILFLHTDEKQKPKPTKYSKSLQKSIDINIINYKYFSRKYIIYQTNRIGKEYYRLFGEDDNMLIFEGEYLNGKRNGKGKEYFSNCELSILNFEGEYLNGKRNGKGKEYNPFNGKLIFEGEYLNGKRNGKGKEYYENGNLKFEGEYLNDLKWNGKGYDGHGNIIYTLTNQINGKGKEYDLDGNLKFEGEYLNGKRNGNGKEYYENGNLKFEGEYLNNLKWNGKGYDNLTNIIYELKEGKGLIKEYDDLYDRLIFEGEYLNGKRNGKGKEYNPLNGKLRYEGEFLNGRRNGKGKEYSLSSFISILIYEGEYLNEKRNGKGKEYYRKYYRNGRIKFEGEYLYDYKIKGKYYVNGIFEFEGEFLFDQKWNGKGCDENGNIIYELINGNGKVKEHDLDGNLKFEGEYLDGKRNGKGKEYNNSKLIFEGEYLNGKRI